VLPVVRQVVIDNNSVDRFVDDPAAYEFARAAVESDELRIWYVHTTLEEVARTPDEERRFRLLHALTALGKPVVSYGFVLGESRLDMAALTDDAGAEALAALASGNLSHDNNRRDALVASTAQANGWAVLTEEAKRLRNRARALNIEVLNVELLADLGMVR
jgi:hypothetical protein